MTPWWEGFGWGAIAVYILSDVIDDFIQGFVKGFRRRR